MKPPVTIDPRLHDAVIFDLADDPADPSIVALGRRLTDAGVRTELGLPGKPDPAILREAARRLGARAERSVVIDDADAGVAAGRSGGFALVIGVDRTGNADELRECGADAVVTDLADVAVRTGDRAMSQIPNALASYDQLTGKFGARRPMVFLDFDGTLSDIVPDPDNAVLVDGAAEALAQIAADCPVAILSGRDLADVRRRAGVPGLWYAGSHGFELVAPDGTLHQNGEAAAAVPVLERAAGELNDTLARISGVRVEHKRFAVAIHYRDVDPDDLGDVVASAHRLGQREHLRVTSGRKVIELRPNVDWDKGTTLNWIGDQIDGDGLPLPIYIGDDLTDEDAFDAVRAGGIGILVRHGEHGDRPSSAQFTLESPDECAEFLRRTANWLAHEK